MIEYIRGTLAELQPAVAVVEAAGVGYALNITLTDYVSLSRPVSPCNPRGEERGEEREEERGERRGEKEDRGEGNGMVKLYVEEVIRDDAHLLYGFLHREDREMFRMLTGVSGVGPGTARLILSELSTTELQQVIAGGNRGALKAIKGIGARTAQRIIVDLCNKINDISPAFINGTTTAPSTFDETLGALTTLGFAQAAVQKVLKSIYKESPAISTEDAIRAALKAIK